MNVTKLYSTVDTQVFGQAFRIVTQSSMKWVHETIEQAEAYVAEHFQFEKNMLLNEPRGHRGMNGCLVLPSKKAAYGLVFFNHSKSIKFKQEALLAVTTALLELGSIDRTADDRYEVETAYGNYTVQATVEDGEVTNVAMIGDACEVQEKHDEYVSVTVGENRSYQLYALPSSVPTIDSNHLAEIEQWGAFVADQLQAKNIAFDGVVLIEEIGEGEVRTVTFEQDGYILRSPSIDVTSAVLTERQLSQLTNTSIFNSSLTVTKASNGQLGIQGEAFVTGSHDFVMDEEDPLQNGFLLA